MATTNPKPFVMLGYLINEGERESCHIQVYLSHIQHRNLNSYKFMADSSQMTWIRLTHDLQS